MAKHFVAASGAVITSNPTASNVTWVPKCPYCGWTGNKTVSTEVSRASSCQKCHKTFQIVISSRECIIR